MYLNFIYFRSHDKAFQLDREKVSGVSQINGTTDKQRAYSITSDARLIIDDRYQKRSIKGEKKCMLQVCALDLLFSKGELEESPASIDNEEDHVKKLHRILWELL